MQRLRREMGLEDHPDANQMFGPNKSIMEEEVQPSPKFQEPAEDEQEDPILILDIKLVKDKPEKIIIYERDVPEEIVDKFCKFHSKFFYHFYLSLDLDSSKQKRLLTVIQTQIDEYYLEQNQQEQQEES